MSKSANIRSWLVGLSGLACVCLAPTAVAQDAMFIDNSGNIGVGTDTPGQPVHVLRSDSSAQVLVEETGSNSNLTMFSLKNNGNPKFRLEDTNQDDVRWEFRIAGVEGSNERFLINKIGSGGQNASFEADGDLAIGGTLSEGSSRSIKDNITAVDQNSMLAKLDKLPISEWNYTEQNNERHVGPMAEDFYSIFKLGPDNKHIAPKDLAGVALAAAKGLKAEVEGLRQENKELRSRLEKLEQELQKSK